MAYETIEVKPATAAIGAEISGVDLARPLGDPQFQEVHDALMAHRSRGNGGRRGSRSLSRIARQIRCYSCLLDDSD